MRSQIQNEAKRKRTIWRTLFGLAFKLTMIVIILLSGYGLYLDSTVRARFDGEKWQLPVMVYSRPLELYPNQRLSRNQMLRELDMLNYEQVRQPYTPGEYSVDGNRIDLIRRAFEFYDGADGARALSLTFNGGRLQKIQSL
ncbi:MAG: penicillin-binding protein 1B, partial [Aeromonas sp.]